MGFQQIQGPAKGASPGGLSATIRAVDADRNGVDTILAPSEGHVGEVGGSTPVISATLTRPTEAPAVQYAAGDIIANSLTTPTVLTFADCARVAGGTGVILSALVVLSTMETTAPQLELWLFDTAPAAQNDNVAFAPSTAEVRKLVAIIPFSEDRYLTGNQSTFRAPAVNEGFQCATGDTNLYGAVVVRNDYTPVSAEVLAFRLKISQD